MRPKARGSPRDMGCKAAEKLIRHWKILHGDNVMIIRGKDKGETGPIKRVIQLQNRVIVEGKNLVKKHIKQGEGHTGGIFSIEAPLHVSNVQVVDLFTGKPCKIGYKYLEDGTKVRFARGMNASGAVIPRPEILKERRKPRPTSQDQSTLPSTVIENIKYPARTLYKGSMFLIGGEVQIIAGPKDTPIELVLEKTYMTKRLELVCRTYRCGVGCVERKIEFIICDKVLVDDCKSAVAPWFPHNNHV